MFSSRDSPTWRDSGEVSSFDRCEVRSRLLISTARRRIGGATISAHLHRELVARSDRDHKRRTTDCRAESEGGASADNARDGLGGSSARGGNQQSAPDLASVKGRNLSRSTPGWGIA